MPELTLTVRWASATEKIYLGDLSELSVGSEVSTTEDWQDPEVRLRYRARIEKLESNQEKLTLVLRYQATENPDAALNDAWGLSTLRLSLTKLKGTAVWRDDRPGDDFGSGRRSVSVRTDEDTVEPELRATLVKTRKQNRFRRDLLALYGECAVSGETLRNVLDAAHILEVKGDGGFAPGNGLLLRTDIHRLFDARLLRIEGDGRVTFRGAARAASTYTAMGLQLSEKVPKRVRRKLIERNRADDA